MNVNKPTDKHIEQYVRYPSKLSQKEKAWIEEWINKDREIHLLSKWYKDFYAEVEKVESVKNKPRTTPSVIHLTPFENRSRYSSGFILAAQTPASGKKTSGLQTVKTFVSEEHKTLIRILHDDDKRQSKLYVISEFIDDEDIVLLDVSEEKSFFVSRPGGKFVISDQAIPIEKITDWSKCRLHLPLSKMNVFKNPETGDVNVDTSGVDRDKHEISFEIEDGQLDITADFGDDLPPEKLVLYTDKHSIFRSIDEGRCSIPLAEFRDTHSVLFFYN